MVMQLQGAAVPQKKKSGWRNTRMSKHYMLMYIIKLLIVQLEKRPKLQYNH